jgi:hypothetical protein
MFVGDDFNLKWRLELFLLLIGIMSGSFWGTDKEPAMFRHSGLFYLTRSSSICGFVKYLALRCRYVAVTM